MGPGKDASIAKLLEESQEMIRRAAQWGGPVSAAVPHPGNGPMPILADLEDEVEAVLDAVMELFIDEDQMTVYAEFRPPGAGGKPLDRAAVEQQIEQRGIVHGVLWPVIEEALSQCNLELELVKDVVIARGEPARMGVPAHIELEAKWQKVPEPDKDAIAIDWKAITPFVMVPEGVLVAHRVAEVEGHRGTTVLGAELPATTSTLPPFVAGTNVAETPEGFFSKTPGRLLVDKGIFSISPVLELDEGVTYKTGNIRFHGDVIVHKNVASGFLIEADGSLSLDCVLEAWKVKSGTDLITDSGIVGRPESLIVVGGAVRAKYLTNVTLLTQGDVHVENSVLGSLVKTRGRLVLGEKGILAGGSIHTLGGVDTYHISTPTGPRTELLCGIDYQGMDQIQEIRESLREFASQLRKIEAAIGHVPADAQDKLRAVAEKMQNDISVLQDRQREHLMSLGQDEAASVIVRGTVWPDTTIEICHVRFLVTQKMSAVKFELDKRKGQISVLSLKKA